MPEAYYIGYKNKIGDLSSSGLSTAASGARVFATGGADISADIALAVSLVTFGGNLWTQWTSHPARDAKDFIANVKPKIVNLDPYNRLISVIAYSQKINPKALDVNTREWLKWYKQNYPNDYMTISPDVKLYWNKYLDSIRNSTNDHNNIYSDLDAAAFTQTEINYNANPVETVTNLFSSTSSGKINWVLYGAIALGAILLIKNIK